MGGENLNWRNINWLASTWNTRTRAQESWIDSLTTKLQHRDCASVIAIIEDMPDCLAFVNPACKTIHIGGSKWASDDPDRVAAKIAKVISHETLHLTLHAIGEHIASMALDTMTLEHRIFAISNGYFAHADPRNTC